ncbi:MAG: hypothetical protein HYZ75_01020 [Elusimicrobia bacterium]|nr:hypothetical protein [Elusimicrobiota bacterium]
MAGGAHAATPPVEAPRLNVPVEEREKRFNLSFRGGEPADSFAKAVKHLYYNVAGEGAIRSGIAHQEEAIITQQAGKPDPAQAALYAAILRCESTLTRLYRVLREAALAVEEEPTETRRFDSTAKLAKAETLANKLPRLVEEAGRLNAAAYRAAGGVSTGELTGEALSNGKGAADAALAEAKTAVRDWTEGSPAAAARVQAKEAASLPPLSDLVPKIVVTEASVAPAAERSRGGISAESLRKRLRDVSFDGQ